MPVNEFVSTFYIKLFSSMEYKNDFKPLDKLSHHLSMLSLFYSFRVTQIDNVIVVNRMSHPHLMIVRSYHRNVPILA